MQVKGFLTMQLLGTHADSIERVLRQVPQLKALASVALAGVARSRALGCREVCLAKMAEQHHPPTLHVLLAIGNLQYHRAIVLLTADQRCPGEEQAPLQSCVKGMRCTAMPGQQSAVPSTMLSMPYRITSDQERVPPQELVSGSGQLRTISSRLPTSD